MWRIFCEELDRWAEAGMVATFWWRDDDAVSDSAKLDDLLRCAAGVPVGLAVIPSLADRSLSRKVAAHLEVAVLQHGWRHVNHVTKGANSEYPAGRDRGEVAEELTHGRERLADLFGAQSLPVFAPPWHGFDDQYLSLFGQAGLRGLSRRGARRAATVSGVVEANIHCAPIAWSTPPSLGSEEDHLRAIVDHLTGRRTGRCDAAEPTGILTHHLVQDERSYEFMSRLSALISGHAGARWLGPREVFNIAGAATVGLAPKAPATPISAASPTVAPLPVFFISYNRGPMLDRTIRGVQAMARPTHVVVQDNASSDAPTLAILDRLARSGIEVVRSAKITAPDELNAVDATVRTYFRNHPLGHYLVSDCDIDLGIADPRALDLYSELLGKFPWAQCVGPMLRIRDIPPTYPLYAHVMNRHIEQFWGNRPEWVDTSIGRVAFIEAAFDTSMALHRAGTAFRRGKLGLRVYEPFEALHLDWYLKPGEMSEYAKYSSDAVAHWNNDRSFRRYGNAKLKYSSFYAVKSVNGNVEEYEEVLSQGANSFSQYRAGLDRLWRRIRVS